MRKGAVKLSNKEQSLESVSLKKYPWFLKSLCASSTLSSHGSL